MGRSDDEVAGYKQQSLALYRKLDDRWGIASLLTELGYTAVRQDDYDGARRLLEEALTMSRAAGDKRYIAFATASLAEVIWYMGDPIRARRLYVESLEQYRGLGDRVGEVSAIRNLGHIAHREGNEREASGFYRQSLRLSQDLDSDQQVAVALGAVAGLIGALGKPKQAARLLGASDTLLETSGGLLPPTDRIQRKYTYETLRSILGEASLSAEMSNGKSTPLEISLQLVEAGLPAAN
jgi:tetratricopeptide (TPR) repeat protein